MSPSNTPSDMPSPTDTYETSVVDLIESPKCFRSPGKCWRAAITATRSPNSSTRSGSASSVVSPRRTSTIFASTASGNVTVPIGTPVSAGRETKNLRDVEGTAVARQDDLAPHGPAAGGLRQSHRARRTAATRRRHPAGSAARAVCWSARAEPPRAARRRQAGDHLRDRDALPLGGSAPLPQPSAAPAPAPGGPEPLEKTRRCRGWVRSRRWDRPPSTQSRASGRRPRRSPPAASACWSAPRQTCPGRAQVKRRTLRSR